jgi:putative membrane protein
LPFTFNYNSMAAFLIKWLVNISALLLVTGIVPGIYVDKWQTAAAAALVLGLLNAFLRPLLLLLTLPFNILSLGILTLVINAALFYLAAELVNGFHIASFTSAFFGALLFSIISFILSLFITPSPVKVTMNAAGKTNRRKPPKDGVIDIEGNVVDR